MIAPVTASSSSSRARIALAILAAGLMSAGVVAVTHAGTPQDADEVPRLAVTYDDLDISTEKGALSLYRRISSAARAVCPARSRYSVRVAELSRNCVSAAIARAVREVNSPQLAKVDAARSNRHPTEG
jgi:UrcA family protein